MGIFFIGRLIFVAVYEKIFSIRLDGYIISIMAVFW